MSIDTGQSVRYRADFPVPGVNQSSRQFRDNFSVLKTAIENLQDTRSSGDSVLTLTTLLGETGTVQTRLSFRDGAFRLPTGTPPTPEAGMIRYEPNVGRVEYHDGVAWRSVATGSIDFTVSNGTVTGTLTVANASFSGRLTLGTDPVDDTDVVNLRTLESRLAEVGGIATIYRDGVSYASGINAIDFVGAGVGLATRDGGKTLVVTIAGSGTGTGGGGGTTAPLDEAAVRAVVGNMFAANVEQGVYGNLDEAGAKINLRANDFRISLTGDVSGSAIVSALNDVEISVSATNFLRGLSVMDEGLPTGLPTSVRAFNFIGEGVSVTQSGSTAVVEVSRGLTDQDVRDEVGGLVRGTIRDPITQVTTESGITVNYDAENNALELGVREFNINLAGAVSGTGRVSRLRDVTITTTATDLLRGLTAFDEGLQLGLEQSARRVDFRGTGVTATQSGDLITVTVPGGLTARDVRDEVGGFLRGTIRDPSTQAPTESGIIVNYDAENNALELGVREFDITLAGAVTGTGRVSRLQNVTISTTTDLIRGLTLLDEGIATGLEQTVRRLDLRGGAISVAQIGDTATITLADGLTLRDVRDEVGGFLRGTIRDPSTQAPTESGVTITYDAENNALEVGVREFDITLAGAVTGTGRVSRLQNVTINTTTDLIRGLTLFEEGVATGLEQTVRRIDLRGDAITVAQSGDTATISLASGLSLQDVRDEVGGFLRGTIRDPSTQAPTESGITLNYDTENNTLEVGVREFDIALTGAVSGSARVSRLQSVSINTTTDLIRGLTLLDEGVATGLPQSVRRLDIRGGAIGVEQTGDLGTITLDAGLSLADVRDEVGGFIRGTTADPLSEQETETGITVRYDTENNVLELGVREFDISLTGAVTGSARVSRLQSVSINTTTDLIRGLTVSSEGDPTGLTQSVRRLDFRGDALGVVQSGDLATITLDPGLSLGDVRNEVGGFIRGTAVDPSSAESTETGITVRYDTENAVLELGVREFDIALTGAVSGTARVSRLQSVTISTTTDLISGLTLLDEGTETGLPQSVRRLDFRGAALSVTQNSDLAIVTLDPGLSLSDVRNEVGGFIRGTTTDPATEEYSETGITVQYDTDNNVLELGVRDFDIALTGAVTGSATVSRLRDVTINTTTDLIRGLSISEVGTPTGLDQTVRRIDFRGGLVSVSQFGDTATVVVSEGLTSSDVRDEVGGFIRGTVRDPETLEETETGITVTYDSDNNVLELGVREFDIALTGVVTGTARVSRLQSVTIDTVTSSLVTGVTALDEGTPTGAIQSVRALDFRGDNIAVTQTGDTATVTVLPGLSIANVRSDLPSFVSGTTRVGATTVDTGITVGYDSERDVLELGVREFDITLTGAVSGTARVTQLRDVTLTTTSDMISGLTVRDEGTVLGSDQAIRAFDFVGGGVSVTRDGATATVSVPSGLSVADVRDTVGALVRGSNRDPVTGVRIDSGITVNYDSANNALELGVREFNVTLSGAVSGTGRVTRLRDVAITTTSNAIEGITLTRDGTLIGGANAIKTVNITGTGVNASVTGSTATLNISPDVDQSVVRSITAAMLVGSQDGLDVTYDSTNQKLRLAVQPISITLTGAIFGTGTVSFDGGADDGSVVIVTDTSTLASLEVRDEGATKGTGVAAINFVGGGVTSSVSVDGQVATVYIPNSPANEKFLIVDTGSSNVPNARRLVPGTGILLTDGGPGGDMVISAESDAIIAKSQIALNGELVSERPKIDIYATQQIFVEIEDVPADNSAAIRFYSLLDGWWRSSSIDCGLITDKYGNSLDMGQIGYGIIETQPNFGSLLI